MLKHALVAVAMVVTPAVAQAPFPEGALRANTIVCDTTEQIKAVLAKDPTKPGSAAAVNADVGENVCEAGFFAFMAGPDGEVLPSGWTLQHVLVVGITKGNMLVPVQPTPQWTAYHTPEPKGQSL